MPDRNLRVVQVIIFGVFERVLAEAVAQVVVNEQACYVVCRLIGVSREIGVPCFAVILKTERNAQKYKKKKN